MGEQGNEVAEGNNSQVLEGNQTQNDLEDIIAGQNADANASTATAEVPAEEPAAEPVATEPVAAETAPAAVAAGPALPEQGSKMPYVVRVGESLSAIAKTIYGNSEKWSEMAELSSIKNPNMVRPGDVVYYQLGQETLAFATAYEGATRTEVTVQSGDTLAGIAKKVYGNEGDWKYVWRQNANIQDPDKLEVGMTISYLTPASLGAALEFAKTMTVAQLMKTFENKTPNTETEAPITANGTTTPSFTTNFAPHAG